MSEEGTQAPTEESVDALLAEWLEASGNAFTQLGATISGVRLEDLRQLIRAAQVNVQPEGDGADPRRDTGSVEPVCGSCPIHLRPQDRGRHRREGLADPIPPAVRAEPLPWGDVVKAIRVMGA